MPDPETTPVIYRVWPEGDVIALFPEIPENRTGTRCLSYQQVGQHAGADCTLVIKATRPATHAEYLKLDRELTNSFGYKLEVKRRQTQAMIEKRITEARR